MKIKYPSSEYHAFSSEEILLAFQTDPDKGLNRTEAEKRNKEFGFNVFQSQKQKSNLQILLRQFKSAIVYLLFFAVAVTLFLRHFIEAISIIAVILINALIGFLMELQARNSMIALKKMEVIRSKVIRDGKINDIPAELLVPGDVILLEAGDIVPGDARLIEVNQLQCDESSLTGESLPSEKSIEKLPKETALGDQLNMVFKGCSVINGRGKAIITGIAQNTQLGTIALLVEKSEERETPLDKKIKVLSKKLIWITLGMTAIFAITGSVQGKDWLLILETSIALAVSAFPEGLPIVATVALSYGVLLMAKRNAIVKKLSAVETLGSTTVILTDKTGTLTENKIFADTLSFPRAEQDGSIKNNELSLVKTGAEKNEEAYKKLELIGILCNNVYLQQEGNQIKYLGDPIEVALVEMANLSGLSANNLKTQFERIGEIPFNSDTKIMGTLHKNLNRHFVAAKGSVEHLLKKCDKVLSGSAIKNLSEKGKADILRKSEKMAAEGLKVLAFAFKEENLINNKDYLNSLIYVGMIGFIDPPRVDIRGAILSCRKAGIKIVMITGDHPLTALNVAKKVGLADESEQSTITGTDIPPPESLSSEWNKKLLSTTVFARTTPKQKLDIVSIYQQAGNIVAMTGDGINDAPALKKADVGIAMGIRGTQVAKETASIILRDDSFKSIEQAITSGREIYQNIRTFVIYLLSCNLSEMLIVTALGFIAPASTLLPLQILFLNMVTDVFPALALGLGKGDRSIMMRPPANPKLPIITNKDWITLSVYAATITFAIIAAVSYCELNGFSDQKALNNVAFTTLAFAQLFHVFNMSSARSNFFVNEITTNKYVWMALLICTILLVSVYLFPTIRLALGLNVLSARLWLVSVLAGLIPVLLVQSYKFFRPSRKK